MMARVTTSGQDSLYRLLSIASEQLSEASPDVPTWNGPLPLRSDLEWLISKKNGFYAFESALHVLPGGRVTGQPHLAEWNNPSGWRKLYGPKADGLLFFAQDAFASQFALSKCDGVVRLNPESGEVEPVAASLEDWARRVLDDFPFETGWTIAKEWQEEYGPLPAGRRLLPKRPFLLGGDFVANNLVAVPADRAMQMLGRLHSQIRSTPDGSVTTVRGWLDFDSHSSV